MGGYVMGILIADTTSVSGVLIMSAVALLPSLLWALGYSWTNLRREIHLLKLQVSAE